PARRVLDSDRARGPYARVHLEAMQCVIRMELRDREARRALAGTVPVHAADETRDIRRDAGRTVYPANRRLADSETQQSQEPADMVDVRVRDEDVGDRVRGARVELRRLADVEQQRAARMTELHEQQRIAEDAVQQRRG